MIDAADFKFDTYAERPLAAWQLDPLQEETGGTMTIERVSLVRIAWVAAETGARMQREGLADDPVAWMVTPMALFDGLAPIEACLKRIACSKAILLHGLGLALDIEPSIVDQLVNPEHYNGCLDQVHV